MLWSLPSGDLIQELDAHEIVVAKLLFLKNWDRLISAGLNEIKAWSAEKDFSAEGWVEIRNTPVDSKGIRALVVSPNEEELAVSMDYKVKFFSLSDGNLNQELDFKVKGVDSLCYSPNGQYFAVGAADKKIRIYKI